MNERIAKFQSVQSSKQPLCQNSVIITSLYVIRSCSPILVVSLVSFLYPSYRNKFSFTQWRNRVACEGSSRAYNDSTSNHFLDPPIQARPIILLLTVSQFTRSHIHSYAINSERKLETFTMAKYPIIPLRIACQDYDRFYTYVQLSNTVW